MPELAAFVKGEGAIVDKTLRKKLPRLLFTFDRHAGRQSDTLIGQLFTEADDMVPTLTAAADRLRADENLAPIGDLIHQLCAMASSNQLTGKSLHALAQFVGDTGQVGDVESILDPSKISLSQTPAAALRTAFQLALIRGQDFTKRERELFEMFILSTSNIEELLSYYFTMYCVGKASDQKTYLYLSWILWAFLRVKSGSKVPRSGTIYTRLSTLGGDVITFNYTNFFLAGADQVKFFHGRLDRYLRVDDRRVVSGTQALRSATNADSIASFIDQLRLDVADLPHVDLPSIVPPVAFKPVMSREQLRVWAEADAVLERADVVVIVGYSLAMADEHFNDLLRKSNPRSRVLVVNPDLDTVMRNACRILDIDNSSLATTVRNEHDVLASGRLIGVRARADELDEDLLSAALR